MHDVLIRAARVVTEDGEAARCVGVSGGRIAAIAPYDDTPDAMRVVDLGDDAVLLPGLVDTHVHVNEPGRTDWEGFASATRAAAAGGITTILDMPLNAIPPTVDPTALTIKRAAAEGQCFVDVGFWGGAIPGSLDAVRDLHDAGVFGFKCFLLDSGVSEFPPLRPDELEAAMRCVASAGGLMIVHAEDADLIEHAPPAYGVRYRDFLASRPPEAERRAVAAVIEAARRTGCRAHIVHLSSAESATPIVEARRDGVRITAETCPHYLTFAAETIQDGATEFKCCPPIRGEANREALWDLLADGAIRFVASDHSPCPAELKQPATGDFASAWGGIASLQLGLPAMWTSARTRGLGLADVTRWMASHPAEVVGLPRKGSIAVGMDADFCVFAPDDEFVVDPAALHHRHPVTPYAGLTLTGRVRSTWLAGREVDLEVEPRGRLLTRGED